MKHSNLPVSFKASITGLHLFKRTNISLETLETTVFKVCNALFSGCGWIHVSVCVWRLATRRVNVRWTQNKLCAHIHGKAEDGMSHRVLHNRVTGGGMDSLSFLVLSHKQWNNTEYLQSYPWSIRHHKSSLEGFKASGSITVAAWDGNNCSLGGKSDSSSNSRSLFYSMCNYS